MQGSNPGGVWMTEERGGKEEGLAGLSRVVLGSLKRVLLIIFHVVF